MSIFRKLFNKPPAASHSYIREWADVAVRKLRKSQDLSPDTLFPVFIYTLSTFADPRTRDHVGEPEGSSIDVFAHFSSDATLFELGCYLYARIDLWLFLNKPKIREAVSTAHAKGLVVLFTRALAINNVPQLFNERVDMYAHLARDNADLEKYYFYLCELILRTKDGRMPQSFDAKTCSLTLDAFAKLALETTLVGWEEAMLPAIFKTIENYNAITEAAGH